MKRRGGSPSALIKPALLYGGLALLVALSTSLALSASSQPTGAAEREAVLDARIATVHANERHVRTGLVYPQGTLCEADLERAGDLLKKRLSAAVPAGAAVTSLFVAPEAPRPNGPDLTPVAFRLEVRGTYEATVATMGQLSQGRPTIFANQATLTSNLTDVTLSLKGEVLCWTGS